MDELRTVLEDNLNSEFLLAVLSNPRRADGPNKVRIRPVRHKDRHVYQFEAFCGTQVFHQNLEKEEACGKILEYMENFRQMQLETQSAAVSALVSKKGKVTVKKKLRARKKAPAATDHNRKKHYILEEGIPVPFLQDLGVMTAEGKIVRTKFDARDLCREVAETFRLQVAEGVVLRLEDSLPRLQLEDYKQGLHQILGNFVRNAVKFTTKGSITIGFSQRPGWVRFYVRDTGIGIPEEERAKIFDRFYKVDTFTQGTGLGLPICKNIAEQLGGRIGVDSAVGAGSCFWVEIPAGK